MIDQRIIIEKIHTEITPKIEALQKEIKNLEALKYSYAYCDDYASKEIFDVLAVLLSLVEKKDYILEYLPCNITIPSDRTYKKYFVPFIDKYNPIHVSPIRWLETHEFYYAYLTSLEMKEEVKQKIYKDLSEYNITKRPVVLKDSLPKIELYKYLRTPKEDYIPLLFTENISKVVQFDQYENNEYEPAKIKIYNEHFEYIYDFIDDLTLKKLENPMVALSKEEMIEFAYSWSKTYLDSKQQEIHLNKIKK